MHIPLLTDSVIILGLSVFVLLLMNYLRLPFIVGFLATGMIAGPNGLGIISSIHEIEQVAEIGVIFLLFTIGIEFSLNVFFQLKKTVLIGGFLQVALTIFFTAGFAQLMQVPLNQAVFLGFLVSLSSTAIVMKTFHVNAEIDSPHGRIGMSILIFQDIIIVLMMISTPILSGQNSLNFITIAALLGKGIAIILLVLLCAKYAIPSLLSLVTRTRNQELFLITIVAICISITWLTAEMGLSPSLGAFLAGLIISESIYSQQALSGVLPFKEVFSSFFFISIGMLFNYNLLWQQPILVLLGCLLVLFGKFLITAFSVLFLRYPLRTALLVGFSLCQIGEFSFVLSKSGIDTGLLTNEAYQLFLAVSVITMALTPSLMAQSHALARMVLKFPWPASLKHGTVGFATATPNPHLNDHLIIVGYGTNGRNVARAAQIAKIPYVVIEMNSETVRNEQKKGEPIFYGDATYEEVLHKAKIRKARSLVIAIADPTATRRTIVQARHMNENLHIIARTRFLSEMQPLRDLGADFVIPEEFETSIVIFTHILQKNGISDEEIAELTKRLRSEGYEILQTENALSPLKEIPR